ncbi:MAG: thiamine ABC transporter substrate-binding protein [Caldilineaceae bacterium]|nr:thiamine ABC transporter substrate-binding protein [Caldilineaceae bacterium]
MQNRWIHTLVLLALLLAGCQAVQPPASSSGTAAPQTAGEPVTLVLASHDSFSVSEDIVASFETTHNVKLQFLAMGDAGESLNKLILSKDAPLADVFFGVDNTFLSRALAAEMFMPYASPLLDQIPDELKLDPDHTLLPVDYGFVNLNADSAWFVAQGLALPQTLEDLTKPEYAGLLVLPNPASSSPGLAFLLTTIAHFGEDGYLDFWAALRANDVLVTDGWSEAYFERFTAGSGGTGDRPLVVSYTTSPPADVVYATDGRTEPATVNISPADGVFRQVEFVGILKTTQHPEQAKALVDFLLDIPFQEDIPLQMFVYPSNENAALPELFTQYAQAPADPVQVDPAQIEANRERWIEAWTQTMLR